MGITYYPDAAAEAIEDAQREEGSQTRNITSDERTREFLEQILITLKKIEYHLYLASDTHLNDQDVI